MGTPADGEQVLLNKSESMINKGAIISTVFAIIIAGAVISSAASDAFTILTLLRSDSTP